MTSVEIKEFFKSYQFFCKH